MIFINKNKKVIFLEDTEWANKYDQKLVKKGFARWLFFKKIAIPAQEEAVSCLIRRREKEQKEFAQNREKILEIKDKIENLTLKFELKKDKNFNDSINIRKIVDEAKKNGIDLKKNQISNFKSIKKTGESVVEIILSGGLKSFLKLSVY